MTASFSSVLFVLANAIALPAWLLNAFAPRAAITQRLARSQAAPVAIAVLYVVGLIGSMFVDTSGSFFTLGGVVQLFTYPEVVLVGWIHFLSFDLFVGNWISLDSQARGVPQVVVVPILFLGLMLGPSGLLIYWIIRGRWPEPSDQVSTEKNMTAP